jgi:hypothetical protein
VVCREVFCSSEEEVDVLLDMPAFGRVSLRCVGSVRSDAQRRPFVSMAVIKLTVPLLA